MSGSAPSLREAQQWLTRAVLGGRSTSPPPRLVAGAGTPFPPRARLHVHLHAYVARLVEVLAGDYAALRAHLGPRRFDRLARAYVRRHPSRAPNLASFGARFPAFLRGRRDVGAFAAQLARLELATTCAFDAAEFRTLAPASLSRLAPSQWRRTRLALNPSVQLLRVPAAVAAWFAAWRAGQRPGAAVPGTVELCIARIADRVVRRTLPRHAAAVLRRLQRGERLGRAIAGVPAAAPIGEWFAQWRADGLFAAPALNGT